MPEATAILRDFFFGAGPIRVVQQTLGPAWVDFFRVVTVPGVAWGIIVAAGLGFWLWGRATAYSVLGIYALEGMFSTLLNQLIFLPRPDSESIVRYEHLEIGSFPSGHVFTATAIWGWLYYAGRLPLWLCGTIVGLVSVSRIYLGVHFVADVVGGFLLGCGLIWVHSRVWPVVDRWLSRRRTGFFVLLGGIVAAGGVAAVTLIEPGNPYAWSATGLMLAAPLAIAVERRMGGGVGAGDARNALFVALGILGILPFLAIWLGLPESSTYAKAASIGAATLWAWMVMPILTRRYRLR